MNYEYHAALGLLAVIIGIVGYIPYYRDIFRGTTKPHPFTWVGICLLNGITFIVQVVTGGGPGAWVTGVTAVATLGIAVLAFPRGEKNITFFDWVCFGGALVGIVLWKLTSNPLWAVIIVTVADLLVLAPTYRKAYLRPHEETVSLYVMGVFKYVVSVFALTSINLTTALFPVAIALFNLSLVAILLLRRKVLIRM
ncbi:MAG: hypothetical protein KBC21_01885 [Candidatus Pacebacteria bacterium]|nr:hypothetical protein [Candidatus Paceibacterota bacterium]